MEIIKIAVYLPQDVAIKQSCHSYGEVEWPIDSDLYTLLTKEERDWLATALDAKGRIDGQFADLDGPPSTTTVIAAIRKQREKALATIAKKKMEEEEKQREREQKIANAVRLGEVEFVKWYNGLWRHEWDQREDPRVVTRWEACSSYHVQLAAEKERQQQECDARTREVTLAYQAKLAAAEKAKETANKEFNDFSLALTPLSLSRAAQEGYAVSRGVLENVIGQFSRAHTKDAKILKKGTKEEKRYTWVAVDSPESDDFKVYDKVKEKLAKINKPASLSVELLSIKRVTKWDREDEEYSDGVALQKFTAVIVWIESPITDTRWVIFPV